MIKLARLAGHYSYSALKGACVCVVTKDGFFLLGTDLANCWPRYSRSFSSLSSRFCVTGCCSKTLVGMCSEIKHVSGAPEKARQFWDNRLAASPSVNTGELRGLVDHEESL